MSEFGNRVKQYRTLKGFTQAELAQMVGYSSKSTINKIEMGYNDVPLSAVERIATALGVTPGTLMGWEEVFIDNGDICLTSDERVLLKHFRSIPPFAQKLCLQNIKNLSAALNDQF